jgi:serine/threonine protein kinase/tetratricopeptide (TPR) repeat protein
MNDPARDQVKELLTQAAGLPASLRAAFVAEHAADATVAQEALNLLPTLEDSAFMIAPTVGRGMTTGAAASVAEFGETAGDCIGPYKLLQRIGEGGFGTVFMAEQIAPVVRRVALKIIKAGMDTRQVIARFEAERQALAMMEHPNIAKILDAGATERGRPYFVMELVRGEPVTRYCDEERLALPQRLELFRQICHAVQHAHQKGIIHRDLKPSNVLVTIADGEPLPKIIDFGIAKATAPRSPRDSVLREHGLTPHRAVAASSTQNRLAGRLTDKTLFTEMHQLIGTPEYMSPEQAERSGVDIDTRSDIYSLGVLLYDLLVGSTPLETARLRSAPFAEIQRLIQVAEAPPPSLRFAGLAMSDSGARSIMQDAPPRHSRDSSAIEIAQRRRSEPLQLRRALRGDLDWIVMKCLEKDRRRRYQTVGALADDVGRYLEHQPVLATPPRAVYKLRKFVQRHRAAVLAGVAVAIAIMLGVVGTGIGLVSAVREQRLAEQQRTIARENANMAQVEADRANREAEQAQAIIEFMRRVLTSVEPENQGADIRLIDVLADASASASERFAGQPVQEAQVRDLLGQSYNKLAMWPEARAEYERVLALWKEHAGADDPRALIAQSTCAGIAMNMGRMREAEPVVLDLLPRFERVFGHDHLETLILQRRAAVLHAYRGRVDEAERILLDLRTRAALADDDGMQIRMIQSLIQVARMRAGYSDGTQPPRRAGVFAELENLADEWVERSMRAFGPDSAVTLQGRAILSEITCELGRYREAAESCRDLLDVSAEHLGECHHVRLMAMRTLAEALAHLGESIEPAELQLHALDCDRQRYSADNPVWLSYTSTALRYLDHAAYATEGTALAQELTDALLRFSGGHGAATFLAELYVARFASMQNQLEEAEGIYQSLIAGEEQVGRADRARLHAFYGSHLVRRGLFEDAERHLNMAVTLVGDIRVGTWDTHPDDIIIEFIALYEAWEKPDQAEAYRRLRLEVIGESSDR